LEFGVLGFKKSAKDRCLGALFYDENFTNLSNTAARNDRHGKNPNAN
jgi:hypothetical protein